MPLASNARKASVLLSQLERRPSHVLAELQKLYPDCRFTYEDARLTILCPSTRVMGTTAHLPKILKFRAWNIIEISSDGTYRCIKHKDPNPLDEVIRSSLGLRRNASETSVQQHLRDLFEEAAPKEDDSPTCWSRLLDEDTWEGE